MKQESLDRYIQTFDELNVLAQNTDEDERVDVAETFLVMAYKRGVEDTEDMLDYLIDTEQDEDFFNDRTSEMQKTIYEKIDGKTFEERINEGLSPEEYQRVLETEYHRVYNETALATAKRIEQATGRSLTKTWRTVLDNKVRATHEPLEGLTKALDEKFYTIDGDESLYPGGFGMASNNCNCRCLLDFE